MSYKTVAEREGLMCPECQGPVRAVRAKGGYPGGWRFECIAECTPWARWGKPSVKPRVSQ